jgi:Rps23 Pro-64 3,4-dihydroxylase Tpa1-like proline 4-hydroxylase
MSDNSFDYVSFQAAVKRRFDDLHADAERLGQEYQHAQPFPFIVIDNFLPDDIVQAVADAVPGRSSADWTKLPTDDQRGKRVLADESKLPIPIRALIQELNSGYFLRFLEMLTGIDDLISDTKLVGGGLHVIERGGKLSVHVDFSHHPTNGLNRRLNLLLYLTRNWQEAYGGNLEFWSQDIKTCEQKVLPVFNRCAIFSTSPISYHGHPEGLNCPDGMTRNSIALYYFTKGRPEEEEGEHNTLFKSRPEDSFQLGNFLVRAASSGMVRGLMPPVIYSFVRKLWNKRFTGA